MKIVFLLIPFFCFSNTKIKCKIVDKNNTPIPYVNIFIKNTPIGTISNEDGMFEIKIPQNYLDKIVVLSSIGFKTKEIPIHKFQNLTTIQLEIETILLEEVLIGKKLSAEQIVQKAFDNYYNNFPNTPFITKGFIRHSERTKTNYKWLVEAALQVYDSGFDKPNKETKTAILEVRKSFDNRELDTLSLYRFYLSEAKGLSFRKVYKNKLKVSDIPKEDIQKAIIFNDNRTSNPSYLFSKGLNIIRSYNQEKAIFDKKFLKKHTFKIDTILSLNDDDVYKIKISPKSPPAKLNKNLGKYLLPFGWIYIRSKDYSIIELEYILIYSNKGQIFTKINGSKIRSKFTIKFIEINGKMYPKYIAYERPKALNRFKSILDSLAAKKTINKEHHYFAKQEILFTEIITNEEEVHKLFINTTWNDDLFSPRAYNEEYWKKNSILLETQEQKKLIFDLEKKASLKKQFRKN